MNLRCQNCGYQNRSGALFCRTCGQKLETEGKSYPVTEIHAYEESLVKCHQCHSPDVTGVCHVCGRLVCDEHKAKPTPVQNYKKSFAPALSRDHIQASHCDEHPHFLDSPLKKLVVPAIILMIAGVGYGIPNGRTLIEVLFSDLDLATSELIVTVVKLLLSLATLGGGIALAVIGIQRYVQEYRPASQGEPLTAVPIMPEQYAMKVREKAHLKIRIAEHLSRYAEVESAEGEISVQALVPRDAPQRVEAYHQKCMRNGWQQPSAFHFGFVTMDNLSVVDVPADEHMPSAFNVIPLKSEEVNLEILESGTGWQDLYESVYLIKQDALNFRKVGQAPRRMPVWFKPVLEPQSAGRTLRLDFDFADQFAGSKRIRELTLSIPRNIFGGRQVKSPILGTNGRFYTDRWVVEWIGWTLDAPGQRTRVPEVTFSFPVTEMDVPLEVTFEIELEGNTLSKVDIQPEHIWLPNGKKVSRSEVGVTLSKTVLLTGDAQIDPDAYSYQYEFSRSSSSTQNDIRLSSVTIKKVLEVLQNNDVHVKSVMQNPAVAEPQDPVLERQGWDILGRWYKELYPIDVHIVLSENRAEEETSTGGVVDVDITLRVRVNTKCPEFEQYVEDQCTALCSGLQQAL
jgi:hypothetical protein